APDGKSVAILVARANLDNERWDSEIAVVDVSTGTLRDLTTDRRGVGSPRWSPRGDRLAFVAKAGSGEDAQSQIFILTLGGGDPKRITNAPKGVQQFAW